eukprot:10650347-Karenia_brevis.AAC.1
MGTTREFAADLSLLTVKDDVSGVKEKIDDMVNAIGMRTDGWKCLKKEMAEWVKKGPEPHTDCE